MTEHVLKCWPSHFQPIVDGRKPFEVRYNNRGYQAGDKVRLREYDANISDDEDERYTGREILAQIGYVSNSLPGARQGEGLNGYVVFSLVDIEVRGAAA